MNDAALTTDYYDEGSSLYYSEAVQLVINHGLNPTRWQDSGRIFDLAKAICLEAQRNAPPAK